MAVDDEGNFIHISGVAVPPDHQPDKNYTVYARLYSDSADLTFEPFPILEPGKFADPAKANVAFSMYLDKSRIAGRGLFAGYHS